MSEIYGHKWTSGYGACTDNEGNLSSVASTWSIGLATVTADQFTAGLNACITSGEPWPPTLPEFREMCLGTAKNEFGLNYTPEVYRKQPERSRDRLLSSDARNAKRKSISVGISALRASVMAGLTREQSIKQFEALKNG